MRWRHERATAVRWWCRNARRLVRSWWRLGRRRSFRLWWDSRNRRQHVHACVRHCARLLCGSLCEFAERPTELRKMREEMRFRHLLQRRAVRHDAVPSDLRRFDAVLWQRVLCRRGTLLRRTGTDPRPWSSMRRTGWRNLSDGLRATLRLRVPRHSDCDSCGKQTHRKPEGRRLGL